MAAATDNRKEETYDFKTVCALDSAAKQILPALTRDRLNKFYNPKLVQARGGPDGGSVESSSRWVTVTA